MLAVTLSLMKRFGISITVQENELHNCNISTHHKHDGLLPFFNANKPLLREYDQILTCTDEPVERKVEVEGYRRELAKAISDERHYDTCYHCSGTSSTTGWAFAEDD